LVGWPTSGQSGWRGPWTSTTAEPQNQLTRTPLGGRLTAPAGPTDRRRRTPGGRKDHRLQPGIHGDEVLHRQLSAIGPQRDHRRLVAEPAGSPTDVLHQDLTLQADPGALPAHRHRQIIRPTRRDLVPGPRVRNRAPSRLRPTSAGVIHHHHHHHHHNRQALACHGQQRPGPSTTALRSGRALRPWEDAVVPLTMPLVAPDRHRRQLLSLTVTPSG
jgi:hypothetical protein